MLRIVCLKKMIASETLTSLSGAQIALWRIFRRVTWAELQCLLHLRVCCRHWNWNNRTRPLPHTWKCVYIESKELILLGCVCVCSSITQSFQFLLPAASRGCSSVDGSLSTFLGGLGAWPRCHGLVWVECCVLGYQCSYNTFGYERSIIKN